MDKRDFLRVLLPPALTVPPLRVPLAAQHDALSYIGTAYATQITQTCHYPVTSAAIQWRYRYPLSVCA